MKRNALALAVCCAALAACGSQPQPDTLANLPSALLPEEPAIEIPRVNIADLQDIYRRALASSADSNTQRQIRLRLADLEMERLEQQQADNPEIAVRYDSAIAQYQALTQDSLGDDYLMYRLARARALNGEPQRAQQALQEIIQGAPESPFRAEALFRRAEAAFNRRDYPAAKRDFHAVLEQGETPFAHNARYMLGWSQFKSAHYRASTQTFLQLLEQLTAERELAQLDSGDGRLAADTLRVLALNFNYQGGAGAIEQFDSAAGERGYQHRLYLALGDWYAEKERYRDGADTLLAYVQRYPQDRQAPALHVRAIEILQQGNFPSEVLPAKREFVQRYGARGEFWAAADAEQRAQLAAHLQPWLTELAQHEHARAQALAADAGKKGAGAVRGHSRAAFLAAAELYAEYAETFPDDARTPQLVFLMAECFDQAGEYARAWPLYKRAAWEFPNADFSQDRRAEAGYAAILAAGRVHAALAEGEEKTLWLDRKTETSLQFAASWPQDARALPALLDAANNLFAQKRYPEAIAAAERANRWQPPPDAQQRRNINLVRGHSQFELRDYVQAEQAYTLVLRDTPAGSGEYSSEYIAAQQRLQASIYQQAQAALAQPEQNRTQPEQNQTQPDKQLALRHLLRIRDSGRTEIAATAQYDAINLLIELQQWETARAELTDFRQFYPQHPLTPTLTAKAVVILQALQLPGAAAGELLALAAGDADPEVRRQSLYLAAEQFQQSGDTARAIDAYSRYSREWREPAAQQLEALYQLAELYAQIGDTRARNAQLQALTHNRADSPRGQYLAAYAQSELAEQSYQSFARIPLRLPLATSLKSKKGAMDAAVADYKKVLDSNVAEFVTQANFRLAEVYRQLSRDLMESQRPTGLNELELEQYDILLEEQAYPFEEKAIELHEANIARTADGTYDDWVRRSFDSLGNLLPARYQKAEKTLEWSDALH